MVTGGHVQSSWRISRTVIIASAVLVATSTASRVALESIDEGGAEAVAVRKLQQDMVNAFNAQDLDRLMAYHDPDVMYLVPNEAPITGEKAVRAMYQAVFNIY